MHAYEICNAGQSCRTAVLGCDLRMGSNYTPQMDCESPSNDPEAQPCTHINMARYSDDIVVMSFPSRCCSYIVLVGIPFMSTFSFQCIIC